jgi:hypothetical protein
MRESSDSPQQRLVGREREEVVLQRFARAAAAGEGAVVLISADTGVGKTAFVDAALSRGSLLAVRAAAAPAGTSPLDPIGALLRNLRRDHSDKSANVGDAASALGGLLSGAGDGQAVTDRATLFDAIGDVFTTIAAGRALALVLDDLQWADHATLEFLPALAKLARSAALLVVAIYRSDAVPPGHPVRAMRETLRRDRLLNEISLAPLDRQETSTLIGRLLDRKPLLAVASAIWERSGGVPLFVEALVAKLQSRGSLDSEDSASTHLPFPETVRDAVLTRLALLPPSAQRAAESTAVASVGGPEFPLELLARLNERTDGIEGLLASGLVVSGVRDSPRSGRRSKAKPSTRRFRGRVAGCSIDAPLSCSKRSDTRPDNPPHIGRPPARQSVRAMRSSTRRRARVACMRTTTPLACCDGRSTSGHPDMRNRIGSACSTSLGTRRSSPGSSPTRSALGARSRIRPRARPRRQPARARCARSPICTRCAATGRTRSTRARTQ